MMKIRTFDEISRKYKIVYADPPWHFKNWSKKGYGRSAINHYSLMETKDIMSMNVNDIADKDCALFLWATYPNLLDALDVIKAWGFVYKTVAFTWVKLNKHQDTYFMGLGRWTRANPELCLLATKGAPKKQSTSVRNLVVAKRQRHSEKPDEVRDRIVTLLGDISRIELFARKSVDGWDAFGNEV